MCRGSSLCLLLLLCLLFFTTVRCKEEESFPDEPPAEDSPHGLLRSGKEGVTVFEKRIQEIDRLDRSEVKKKRNKSLRKGPGKAKKEPSELEAIRAWAASLTEKDYEEQHWREAFHSNSAADFFNAYARKISSMWKEHKAKVNFALIGACDGLGDSTIKKLYLPNPHWRGVFVEPMSINVRDLVTFMANKGAEKRSVIIRAAATSKCVNETILVERPLYEEKNASLPHWLRRQIGSVLPQNRDHARKEWTIEEVRCVTARFVLREWGARTAAKPVLGTNGSRFRRPHILKIDVEGHDFDVLMGFLSENVSVQELPLIIAFEAKSIAKKYPIAKQRMEELGFAVTSFGQDGFALLKKERVLESIGDTAPRSGFVPDKTETIM